MASGLASGDDLKVSIDTEGALARFALEVPDLSDPALHKGSCGRIGILGGSPQYTGAPYYAGISCLKFGADLAYVFAAQEAALAIKSYSPELMVMPVYNHALWRAYDESQEQSKSDCPDPQVAAMVSKISSSLEKLHGLLIGPGLGRHPGVMSAVKDILTRARGRPDLRLVLDADALYLLASQCESENVSQILPANAVLTPNLREFERLWRCVISNKQDSNSATLLDPDPSPRGVARLASEMGNCTIVLKGEHDIISNGIQTYLCQTPGGLRRSGGQGDILAGCISTAVVWANTHKKDGGEMNYILDAVCSACHVVKVAQSMAFDEKRRSMTAPDVIDRIGEAFQQVFPI
eukprot:g381.t1